MLDQLIALANYLDEQGEYEDADKIDKLIAEAKEDMNKQASLSKAKIFDKLSSIADNLDNAGYSVEADMIDEFINKYAEDVGEWKEEEETEQSKRYDSEYHHDLQIREPKGKSERTDREGYDAHSIKTYRNVKEAASTRYCPEHIGVQLGRVGESQYQCSLDGKVYNWEAGWTDYDGKQHAGGSVAAQTPDSADYSISHRIFDSRENMINRIKD